MCQKKVFKWEAGTGAIHKFEENQQRRYEATTEKEGNDIVPAPKIHQQSVKTVNHQEDPLASLSQGEKLH